LTGTGPGGFRLLLLIGCLAFGGGGGEGFDTDDLSAPQRDHGQYMRSELHSKDTQFWYTIRVFLEKEANDLDVLQVSFEGVSLA